MLNVATVNIRCYKNHVAPKTPYHRGNLKEELLDAAASLITEVGVKHFTLREVARRARVSHNAPYRHFRDKDDLLVAVAAQGFDRLTQSMLKAMASAKTAEERFCLSGRGYVQFALQWPEHIHVMFDLPQMDKHTWEEIGHTAFQVLLDAVAALQEEGGLPKGDPIPYALVAWSAVHGFAKLAIAGHVPLTAAQALGFTDFLSTVLRNGLTTQTANKPHN